jgi:hypothetical protein
MARQGSIEPLDPASVTWRHWIVNSVIVLLSAALGHGHVLRLRVNQDHVHGSAADGAEPLVVEAPLILWFGLS